MRMGQDGVAFVKPEANGGLPMATETPPTIDTNDNNTDPVTPDVEEPPQTDYDIYDQVDEIKHKQKHWYLRYTLSSPIYSV